MEGLESPLNVNSLLKKASLEKSFFDQILVKFSLLDPNSDHDVPGEPEMGKRPLLLVVAGLSGLVVAGMGLAKWGVWGAWPAVRWVWSSPTRFWPGERKRRLKKFEKQLPDALDLLARGLRAGHAFPTGLQQVAKEMADPLGTEFFETFREFNHGLDLNTALLNLCHRVDLRDLSFFTTAVLIQRETGGNLTEILEKISILIRERFKLTQSGQSPNRGRPVVRAYPPPPATIAGWHADGVQPEIRVTDCSYHPTGQVLCAVALGFQLVGMLWIHKIVNIKV